MQVTCPTCETLLQLNSDKLPSGIFSIRCPKCEYLFSVTPPVPDQMEQKRVEDEFPVDPLGDMIDEQQAPPAPPVARTSRIVPPSNPAPDMETPQPHANGNDLVQALLALLSSSTNSKNELGEIGRRRRLVACLSSQETIVAVEAALDNQPYSVLIAQSVDEITNMFNTGQQIDVLLLDPGFQAAQQGSASIMRFINSLNPQRRRRLYLAVISQSYQTQDTQAAFMHGVNLVINTRDLDNLPVVLSEGIKSFNNLYRVFNAASGLGGL